MSFGLLTLPPRNNAISSASSLTFSTQSATPTSLGISVTLNTSGRPVFISLVPDGSASASGISLTLNTGTGGQIGLYSSGGLIANFNIGTSSMFLPCALFTIDNPLSGSVTYTVKANVNHGGNEALLIAYMRLVAFEL